MVAHPTPPRIAVEEYLELEENSTVKHEYIDGHVYAMAGGSLNHDTLGISCVSLLHAHLRGSHCRIVNADVKVQITPTRYVYPDVAVSCDPRDRGDGNARFIAYPLLLVEILSPSTATYDRGDKRVMYQALASLQHFVLISAEEVRVEVWTRTSAGEWQQDICGPRDDALVTALDFRVPVGAFYDDIVLDGDAPLLP